MPAAAPAATKRTAFAVVTEMNIQPSSADRACGSASYSGGPPVHFRVANAFGRNVEDVAAAVSLHFMYYNFARPHMCLANPYPRTPAMAAAALDHLWKISGSSWTQLRELTGNGSGSSTAS